MNGPGVPTEMLVLAMIVPMNAVGAGVAELPTCQYTLHGDAPLEQDRKLFRGGQCPPHLEEEARVGVALRVERERPVSAELE